MKWFPLRRLKSKVTSKTDMKGLTYKGLHEWCVGKPLFLDGDDWFFFNGYPNVRMFNVQIPERVALQRCWVNFLLEMFQSDEQLLFVFRDWNIDSRDDGLVDLLMAALNQLGFSDDLRGRPGCLIGPGERDLLAAFFRFILAFEWGGELVGSNGEIILRIDDGFLYFVLTKTPANVKLEEEWHALNKQLGTVSINPCQTQAL